MSNSNSQNQSDIELKTKIEAALSQLNPLIRQAKKQGLITSVENTMFEFGNKYNKEYEYYFGVKIKLSRMI